jgi:HupE / UreJ protein
MLAKDQSIGWSLFSFNIGLEAGQIVVVAVILILSFLAVNKAGLKRKCWVWGLSMIALSIGFKMAWERFPALLS